MGIGLKFVRAIFGVIVLVGVVLFLFSLILVNPKYASVEATQIVIPSTQNFKHLKDFNLHYVSKRRVPNGPNPIHNRRFVKYSRQPPGRT